MYGRVFFVALGLVGGGRHRGGLLASAAELVISGTITLGTLVALAAYVTRIYAPLTVLTNARVDVMTALVSFERVFEVLDAPNPHRRRPGAVDLHRPAGRIEFDDVGSATRPPRAVSVASLEVGGAQLDGSVLPRRLARRRGAATASSPSSSPGKLVALVGPSGAGKTTLGRSSPASTT